MSLGGAPYASGPLAFDQENPSEDPPYGLWGILNDARIGGFFQPFLDPSHPDNRGQIVFENVTYSPGGIDIIPEPATAARH